MVNYISIEDAAARLASAERIMIIGCSGGGKSTLAKKIADRFGLALFSLDRDVIWLPGWVMRPAQERRRLTRELAGRPRWVIDGTSPSSFDLRLPRSDLVIWVRLPRHLCLFGVVSRWLRHMGRTRPDMAPGCPEKIDLNFLHYIWTFERRHTPKILAAIAEHGPAVPLVELRSRREIRRLLDHATMAGA